MKAVIFPGQGSQFKGMGRELFGLYPDAVRKADEILGYSLSELCLEDPRKELDRTEFTQPAIFVASVMAYRRIAENGLRPAVLAGHSVGEYAALTAANVFDLETGLTLVKERARLMGEITGGALAAVLNHSRDAVEALIEASGLGGLETANINSPVQIVIGGPRDKIHQFAAFCNPLKIHVVPLRVSGPFHTSLMRPAVDKFRRLLDAVQFRSPEIPVIANLTGTPHSVDQMADTLARHIASPVVWMASVERMLDDGVKEFIEIGERPVLSAMIADIRTRHDYRPHIAAPTLPSAPAPAAKSAATNPDSVAGKGRASFCASFGCQQPLVACALGNGASGPELVRTLARGGTLAFLDTDAIETAAINASLASLAAETDLNGCFGISIVYDPDHPEKADDIADVAVRHGVRHLELRGFDEPPAFLTSLRMRVGDASGEHRLRVIARISTIEAVDGFLGTTEDSSSATARVDALCVDLMDWRASQAPAHSLIHQVLGRRDAARGSARVFVGVGGMSGSPQSVQALWAMGVDFAAIGSPLLMSSDSGLTKQARSSLSQATYDHFRPMADWISPELSSRSWVFSPDLELAHTMDVLQAWYLSPSASAEALGTILAERRGLPAELASLRSLILQKKLSPRELRRHVRTAAAACRTASVIECDGSLPQWNTWLSSNPQGDLSELSASRIASLLQTH